MLRLIFFIVSFSLLMAATYVYAGSGYTVSGGVLSGEGTAPSYTEEYWWNGDYNGGDDDTERSTAQITHRTSTSVGTPSAAAVFSSVQQHDGTYSFLRDAWQDTLTHTQAAGEICSPTAGYYKAYVRLTANPTGSAMEVFEMREDSSHYARGVIDTNGYLALTNYNCSVTGTTALSTDGSWNLVEFSWDTSGADYVRVRVDGGSWDQSAACTITTWATAGNDNFLLGGFSGASGTGSFYMDEVQVWTTADGS